MVLVHGRSKIFLAGPPLVKAAIGEIATDEELGGAEMHAKVSGLAEYLAEDDAHAHRDRARAHGQLPWNERLPPPPRSRPSSRATTPTSCCGVVPVDYRKPYDVREVIARIVDGSRLPRVQAGLRRRRRSAATRASTASAVGILGNNGPIQPDGSAKAAQFIQLCDQTGTPLVFLQNTTGYMVGRDAERAGIVKHGAKMIQAVANARVPKFTVHIGGSFGAGNYGMCGRAFDPRFIFAWPNARIAVMGGEQAAEVMAIVTEDKLERDGKPVDRQEARRHEGRRGRQMEKESDRALRHRAAVGRRHHRPARHPPRARAVPGDLPRGGGAASLRPNTFGVARM